MSLSSERDAASTCVERKDARGVERRYARGDDVDDSFYF